MNRRLPLALAAPGGPRRLRISCNDVMARLDQRVEAWHREYRRSHEDDPHRRRHCEERRDEAIHFTPLDCFAPLAMTEDRYGVPGDRSSVASPRTVARPRPALGAPRGASPDEAPRDRAPAAPRRAPKCRRKALRLLDLRQCRHLRPVLDLPRP